MSYHGKSFFGQTEDEKVQLSAELEALEDGRDQQAPITIVRGAKALRDKLRALPRWDDSRSGISASFQTLWSDTSTKSYLSYTDISSRVTALLAWGASHLTPEQAQAEGVGGLQRINRDAAEEHLSTTQRLSTPGGSAWEVARETPEPFVDEAVRRGGQARDVGAKVWDKAAPVGQGVVDRLDEHNVTNPLLGVVSLALIVFMKNKLLAILIVIALIYLTKQRQIAAVKARVQGITDSVAGAANKVTGAAEAVQDTAQQFKVN